MQNLKTETLDELTKNGKKPSDVKWCGSRGHFQFSFDDFLKIADIEYDSGYGGNEIARDLVIVGENWWLERGEYDGSEWWEFKTLPLKPDRYVVPESLCVDSLNDN